MKLSYVVLNLNRGSFDEEKGLIFKSGGLSNGTSYSLQLFDTLEAARTAAKQLATSGSVGVIFELFQAMLIKPVPVEIITVGDRS